MQNCHGTAGAFPPAVSTKVGPFRFLNWNARVLPQLGRPADWLLVEQAFTQEPRFWVEPAHAHRSSPLADFVCPTDGRDTGVTPEGRRAAFTHYLGVAGTDQASDDGCLYADSRVRLTSVADGTSNTLLFGERPPSADAYFGWWYAGVGQMFNGSADSHLGVREFITTFRTPTCPVRRYTFGPGNSDDVCDTFHFWSQHPGGAHFGFADGSARFLHYSVAPLPPALATRAGGETSLLP